MATKTYTLIGATYALEEDAIADYEDVRKTYEEPSVKDADEGLEAFDAAVVSKYADGSVHIVKSVEEPTRHGAVAGLVGGLAVGALVAVFPAVALGAGLAVGGASGAAIGATAGHVSRGMSRGDLKELGERLDTGSSGLVVVVEPGRERRVEAAITRAKDIVKKTVEFDEGGLKTDLESL
jgi:uncharacterized membrane protein